MEPDVRGGRTEGWLRDRSGRHSGLVCDGTHTGLQKSDLVVLTEHAEAWDVLRKLNHVLHGVRQSDGAVLPHFIHWLKVKERRGRRTDRRVGRGSFVHRENKSPSIKALESAASCSRRVVTGQQRFAAGRADFSRGLTFEAV